MRPESGLPSSIAQPDARSMDGLPQWALLAFAGLLAVGVSIIFLAMRITADDHLRAAYLLARFEGSLNSESAEEWRTIAETYPSRDTPQGLEAARVRSAGVLRQLLRLHSNNRPLKQLGQVHRDYTRAVDEELALLAQGRIRQADELDEERVDPYFEELHALTTRAESRAKDDALEANHLVTGGSTALIFLTVVVVINMFRVHSRQENRTLRESEERFRALVQNSSDVIQLVDSQGRITSVTQAVKRVLGYEQEELVGRNTLDLAHPSDLASAQEDLLDLLQEPGGLRTITLRVRHKDGSWRWIEATGTNLLHDVLVGFLVVNYRDVSERKALEGELSHQAFHDPLTRLPNRLLFKDRVQHALARRSEHNRCLAVLLLDLDNFKAVNDSLGHDVGDQLLVAVTRRLKECLRPSDTLARLGGDEFAILLEGMQHVAGAVLISERIVEILQPPFDLGNRHLFARASIGIVTDLSPDTDTDQLLRKADTAMYVAKSKGKATYEIFEPHMEDALKRRVRLEIDLRRAVEESQFTLRYQPIVELAGGKICGLEALLRWEHPQRGLILPLEFIPLTEETGLIVPVGRWVLREACIQARRWQIEHGRRGLSVNVNVSAIQLQDAQLAKDVEQALQDSDLAPGDLILEITESALMQDTDVITSNLEAFKEIGVCLAIDDFGSGYSSLGYLRRFAFDIIKIDKSFVEGLGTGPQGSGLAGGIVKLSQSLGLQTCAEGIESDVQLAELRALGCELGQGYYFEKPMKSQAVSSLLAEGRPARLS
ncbi:MAG: EAL domain-containing protein [Actinomycetota bacterium]|nr:EAL domain-containing protein [Actinomycetota bacterium]